MGPDSSDAVNCTFVVFFDQSHLLPATTKKQVEADVNGKERDFICVGKTVATVCQCLPITKVSQLSLLH